MQERLHDKLHRHLARTVVTRSVPINLDAGAVSFTFDDIPSSAAVTGARILEDRGVRGTFYVCGALAGMRTDFYPLATLAQVAELAARGHEIGCHTATHPRATEVGCAVYMRDVGLNARLLEPVLSGRRLRTFAYPYGAAKLRHKLALQAQFQACRGIHGGMMEAAYDRGRLSALALESASIDEAGIDTLLRAVRVRRSWLVFYAHDVSEQPSRFGLTPEHLAYAVDGALARGCRVETVHSVLSRMSTQSEVSRAEPQ